VSRNGSLSFVVINHKSSPNAAWHSPAFVAAALVLLAMATAGALTARAWLLTLATGLALALPLRRVWSPIELLGVSVALMQVFWGCCFWAVARLGVPDNIRWVAVAAAFIGVLRRATQRAPRWRVGTLDVWALVLMAIGAAMVFAVQSANGIADTTGGRVYRAASWYSRDAFYAFSLAEMARARLKWPNENPFFAGVPNYYPALAHLGLAGIAQIAHQRVAIVAGSVLPMVHLATLALLPFAVARATTVSWTPAAASVAGPAAIWFVLQRPDLFVFPQTNSLVAPLLILLIWLLGPRPGLIGTTRWAMIIGLLAALVLAHTVTAAIGGLLVGWAVLIHLVRTPARPRPWVLAMLSVGIGIRYVQWNSMPCRSLAATGIDWRQLSEIVGPHRQPWWIPTILTLLLAGTGILGRRTFPAVGALSVSALGIAYICYGVTRSAAFDRWFVLVNAERFAHAAMLLALPSALLLAGWRRLLLFMVLFANLVAFPPACTRNLISLIKADPECISDAQRDAFEFIVQKTRPNARFVVMPPSYAVAAFTGRAQLTLERLNVWAQNSISPSDFEARVASRLRIFDPKQSAMTRLHELVKNGMTHVALNGLPPDRRILNQWLTGWLPPGTAEVVFWDDRGVAILALTNRIPDQNRR
jgi:hypothetical protein